MTQFVPSQGKRRNQSGISYPAWEGSFEELKRSLLKKTMIPSPGAAQGCHGYTKEQLIFAFHHQEESSATPGSDVCSTREGYSYIGDHDTIDPRLTKSNGACTNPCEL
ncbi:unnamed protein product [Lepeophtheirus salmonis]|uniref:(salmon louse) hypothetical protein n=1 Tax=Lepeophtheirus salmonis TaxID=72036 RepID=A0A7R8HAT2_LEPSM|nr:unnamed protein product [Lepeophtheirus salmonis]CAF2971420.1 unnamed protein product [Lepeophtheirus salmonis]